MPDSLTSCSGRAELNQEKLVPAVTDLKAAVSLLQDDAADQQQALYYLGYAYAKQNHRADAVAALQKAAGDRRPLPRASERNVGENQYRGAGQEEMS